MHDCQSYVQISGDLPIEKPSCQRALDLGVRSLATARSAKTPANQLWATTADIYNVIVGRSNLPSATEERYTAFTTGPLLKSAMVGAEKKRSLEAVANEYDVAGM